MVRRELWSRESPAWLWATFLALLLVALVAGAIVAVAATRDGEKKAVQTIVSAGKDTTRPVGVITDPGTLTLPSTETVPPFTESTVTIPTLEPGTTTTTTTTTSTTNDTSGIRSWPAGKDGFTIVLASIETSKGREPAERRANQAITNGLAEVGILDSSDYINLNPGYYVVFTGVYDRKQPAVDDLGTARASGFPLAYVRDITP